MSIQDAIKNSVLNPLLCENSLARMASYEKHKAEQAECEERCRIELGVTNVRRILDRCAKLEPAVDLRCIAKKLLNSKRVRINIHAGEQTFLRSDGSKLETLEDWQVFVLRECDWPASERFIATLKAHLLDEAERQAPMLRAEAHQRAVTGGAALGDTDCIALCQARGWAY